MTKRSSTARTDGREDFALSLRSPTVHFIHNPKPQIPLIQLQATVIYRRPAFLAHAHARWDIALGSSLNFSVSVVLKQEVRRRLPRSNGAREQRPCVAATAAPTPRDADCRAQASRLGASGTAVQSICWCEISRLSAVIFSR